LSTAATAAASATAATTCVVEHFTLVLDKERGTSTTTTSVPNGSTIVYKSRQLGLIQLIYSI
jgi:hypothetical protein